MGAPFGAGAGAGEPGSTRDVDSLRKERALREKSPQHRKMEHFPRALHHEYKASLIRIM
jgi:hypothetical protein